MSRTQELMMKGAASALAAGALVGGPERSIAEVAPQEANQTAEVSGINVEQERHSAIAAAGKKCVDRTFQMGSTGKCVTIIQDAVDGGYRNPRIKEDGAFGKRTKYAVRKFQANKKMPVDGVVSERTWKSICRGSYVVAFTGDATSSKRALKNYRAAGCKKPGA